MYGLEGDLGHFVKLADDISLVDSEQQIQQTNEQLSQLVDQLQSFRSRLEVGRVGVFHAKRLSHS